MSQVKRESGGARSAGRLGTAVLFVIAMGLAGGSMPAGAQNEIETENLLPGTPAATWDISGAGDLSIQGFATDISVNKGETITFKIDTDAAAYHIDIYRLGWYGGDGARLIEGGVLPSASLPQVQPAPLYDSVTGLTDCGNWAVSASWDVPASAVSGIYIARLVREDTNGASHIAFVVRDDDGGSEILFSTSDATWQAYNNYGGNNLYSGSTSFPSGHAAKVSYNRPFISRIGTPEDWLFNAEFPMLRWLEKNGYDVSYTTNIDTERRAAEILEHQVFLSVGHDEYWSAGMRAGLMAARDAGVNLAFLSGNEIYWKTRWEPSTDGSNTPYRTLVCYKEGTLGENVCGGKCDPDPNVWTGLWRDGCSFTPPADGCDPENSLSGQISWDGSTGAIQVPDTYKNLRLWRNTSVASLGAGQTATLGSSTLGYEWDPDQYPASYPPGRVRLSRTQFNGKTHHLSLYRHASGALVFGAGTVQWCWGLDSVHDRGSDAPVPAIEQATVNLLAEMGAQATTLDPALTAATASGDLSAPVTTIGFPTNGGTTPSGTTIVVNGTAAEVGGGTVGGVEVSVDNGATWAAATGTTNWTYSWTPGATGSVTIRSRGVDDWGNLETPGASVTVTVTSAPPPTCPCTAWDPGTVPGTPDAADASANELGVRFRADVDGVITGVRFYKSAANTGTHIGKLYTNGGTLLASDTFTGESASGWQEVTFSTPVPVTAGVTYVASVWMPAGHYAFTGGFFANSGLDNTPLHLLQNGIDGANGVYATTQGFPTQTFNSANYWVDVVFDTEAGPDVTPPSITAISPGNNATGVAVGASVTATFSEAMNDATINGTTFELRDVGNALVPATVSYSAATRTATLTPTSVLAYSGDYTARVTTGVEDVAGNALAAEQSWTFSTAAPPPPPPNEGPGGPILVISAATNPFSRYPVEILRTEGLNAFTAMDLSLVTPAVLADYDVVVLGECALSAGDVTMLTDWTTAGGTLVAFRPDAQLAPLLGLTPVGGTLSNAYLLVDTASGPGVGIVGQTIQFHGAADLYTLNGATAVAMLYSDATTATSNPAVTSIAVGSNGGRAVAFTYDLAKSVVYTRQGNPAWAGTKRDGEIEPIRSDDMFYGNAAGDPQPDWIDFDKIAIPQADEQQRLMANAILQGNLHRMPLPRFWYLPKGLKAAIVMTGDNHGDGGMAPRFDIYRNQSTPGCSVDDWECIRATGYLYLGSTFLPAQATFYQGLGFEVSLHINTNCARATASEYEGFVSSQTGAFSSLYPDVPLVSNRNHCIAFSDWSSVPEIQAAHGIRFDTNYYYWPAGWVQNRPGMFTGSGMPMRFAKLDGTIIDCFQAVTQMPDESGESFPAFCNTLLDRAQGPEGYYGVFTTNMHFDSSPHAGSDAIVASAQAHGVPVVSSKQMLTWLDGRNGSSFGDLAWSGNQLSFSIAVGAGANNLRAMLPVLAAVGQLDALTRNGNPVAFTTETIKGIEYAFFPADPGSYAATYLVDETAPVITALTATPHGDGTATITWTTDEASDSHVDYGTAPGSLGTTAGSAALVTSHSVQLGGLAAATTYYLRVRSADAASNEATEPDPPASPLSFVMPDAPCFEDRTTADFTQGTTGSGTALTTAGDGGVSLSLAIDEGFSGTSLPVGWTSAPWSGGTATVAGGLLSVNGAEAYPTSSFGPGGSLEFTATFQADAFENIGFAQPANFTGPWITIGTGSGGGDVYARSSGSGDQSISTGVAGGLLGSSHLYRIDWSGDDFTFFVDGVQKAALTLAAGATLVPVVSDFNNNGLSLTVDRLTLSPYATSGSYTSRVFDSGGNTTWDIATWSASVPAGTTLDLFQRQGPTPTPDGSWTAFASIPASGTNVGGSGRYIQYRADLATSVNTLAPVLQDIQFACTSTADITPPVISNVTATPGTGGTTADIAWDTDEGATSRVDYGTSPGALTLNASAGTLTTVHGLSLSSLAPSTTYYYRVTSVDASANAATEPDPPASPLSFVTEPPAPTPCAGDQTAADFTAGTHGSTVVTPTGDGAVALAPSQDESFSGTSLPAGWASYDWPYDGASVGTSTVSGGLLTVDGARANPDPSAVNPGVTLEFVATFSGDANQHIGFGGGNQSPPNEVYNVLHYAMFSTQAGGTLKARIHNGTSLEDFDLGAGWLGAPHLFRIDWSATDVIYSIDGTPVHTAAIAVAGPMRFAASDLTFGGGVITVDWMHMTPYLSPGTFTSRVHDGGGPVSWASLSWTATTPAGTGIAMSVRGGDDPDTNHPSWTAFQPVATPGDPINLCSRYLQYRAVLTTSDPSATPSLLDVTASCTPGATLSAIADLASSGSASPPDASGRRAVLVTWSGAGGGGPVQVYRKGYGDYPTYRPGVGAVPSLPATPAQAVSEGWTLTTLTASGQEDLPPTRDFWYYAAFNTNACGSASTVSNLAGGTLDYTLGDFSDGITACAGDNSVDGADLSLLGMHYGEAISGPADPNACIDVGPTVGYAINGRPIPDGVLEFEDLVLCALNFTGPGGGSVVAAEARIDATVADDVRLDVPGLLDLPAVGETFVVPVWVQSGGRIHALRLELGHDPAQVEILGADAGPGLTAQAARGVVLTPRPGRVDVALLGRGVGFLGEGVVARVRCRRIGAGDPGLTLAKVDARDAGNQSLALGGAAPATGPDVPGVTRLAPARPNPFRGTVALSFSLAHAGPVELALYSVDGRRVRTLVRGPRDAGEYALSWDGRDDDGTSVSAGVYYVRLVTLAGRMTRTVTYLR